MNIKTYTLGSLCAGSGGFDLAFERSGFECRWAVEIDAKCRSVLRRHFQNTKLYEDVKNVTGALLGGVDVVTYGFPCQTLSVAGKRQGMFDDEGNRTRSGLFYECLRVVGEVGPRVALFENVPGFLYHDGGRTFDRAIHALKEMGYDTTHLSLDAEMFGVAQHRERVYGISTRESERYLGESILNRLAIIGKSRGGHRPQDEEQADSGSAEDRANGIAYAPDTAATLRSGGDGGIPSSRGENIVAVHQNASGELRERDTAYTVSTNGNASGRNTPILRDGIVIRRFSCVETERLMGFPDNWTTAGVDEHFQTVAIPDTHRRRMMGNAVVVPVVEFIAKRIIKPALDFVDA